MENELLALKEQKEITITVFGDSVSKGVYLDENLNVRKLEYSLIDILESRCNIKIMNHSIFGQTLKRLYEKESIDQYIDQLDHQKQNIVILWIGGNDADYNWEEVIKNPTKEHSSKTSLYEFEKMLQNTLEKLKNVHVIPLVFTLFPINSERYFHNVLTKKYDEEKLITFLHHDITNLYRHQESFNNAIVRIGAEYNVLTIDIRSIFLNEIDLNSYTCEDGIHPNQKAQEFLYHYIFLYSQTFGSKFHLELK